MNLNFTGLLILVQINSRQICIIIQALIDEKPCKISYFLAAILDFQDGCHSIITSTYTRTFLTIRIVGLDTKFVIVCNLEGSSCGIFNLEPDILKMVT